MDLIKSRFMKEIDFGQGIVRCKKLKNLKYTSFLVRFINVLYEQVVLYRRRLFAEDVECEETWTEFCVCYRGNDAIREAD